jgi:hypothetical protein
MERSLIDRRFIGYSLTRPTIKNRLLKKMRPITSKVAHITPNKISQLLNIQSGSNKEQGGMVAIGLKINGKLDSSNVHPYQSPSGDPARNFKFKETNSLKGSRLSKMRHKKKEEPSGILDWICNPGSKTSLDKSSIHHSRQVHYSSTHTVNRVPLIFS